MVLFKIPRFVKYDNIHELKTEFTGLAFIISFSVHLLKNRYCLILVLCGFKNTLSQRERYLLIILGFINWLHGGLEST